MRQLEISEHLSLAGVIQHSAADNKFLFSTYSSPGL